MCTADVNRQGDAQHSISAMNLGNCVPRLVWDTVQVDGGQLNSFHKSYKVLEMWKKMLFGKIMTTIIVYQEESSV
jgi:hypothetical protein